MENTMDMTTISVQGMSCQHCVQSVTKALESIAGLKNINVDLTTGTASFDSDESIDIKAIHTAIRDIGFETVE